MKSFALITIALLLLALAGCQTRSHVRDSTLSSERGEEATQTREHIDAVDSGGRWVAALEASDDPRRVYVLDQDTDWVYEVGGDARVTIERLEWLEEDALEIHGGGYSVVLRILPPEPDNEYGSPRFVVMRPERYDAAESDGSPQGSSITTYGPATSSGGGSLTLGSIHTMKDRLKRESYQRRGPRAPQNN
jgi:hypothetical protein